MDPTSLPQQVFSQSNIFDTVKDGTTGLYTYEVCLLSDCEDDDMINITYGDIGSACGVATALNTGIISQAAIEHRVTEFRTTTDVCGSGWLPLNSVVIRRRFSQIPRVN